MELVLRVQNDVLKIQNELMNILPELKNKPYICEIKPYKTKRSLDSNAYFHVLVDKIAKQLNASTNEIKKRLNLDYGTIATDDDGEPVIVPLPKNIDPGIYYPYTKWINDFKAKNGREYSQYLFYKETHLLNNSEMTLLIDGVVQEAKELGIETLTPIQLEALKGYKKEIENVYKKR